MTANGMNSLAALGCAKAEALRVEPAADRCSQAHSDERFLLSCSTGIYPSPEVEGVGVELSSGDDGEVTWGAILDWMRSAGIRVLHCWVEFDGSRLARAVWLDEEEPTVWLDVPAVAPQRRDNVGWGLAFVRYADAALLALSRHFTAGPPPTIPRTTDEAALEASGGEPAPPPMAYVLLPEGVRPASRDRLWIEIGYFFAEGGDALAKRWLGLEQGELMSLQAAGVREVQRWVKAVHFAGEGNEVGEDRQLQAVALMGLGRKVFDSAVRHPKRFLDTWPENDGEGLLIAFEIP